MKKNEKKNKHMTLDDRIEIQECLSKGMTFKAIGERIRPAVNQVLAHIGSTPEELIAFCRENGMAVEAYSPIAHGEALRSAEIVSTAKKYGVSPARLCIKYILQLGLVALPKASSREHIRENAELDFTISDEDMKMLRSVSFRDYGEYSYFPVFSGK